MNKDHTMGFLKSMESKRFELETIYSSHSDSDELNWEGRGLRKYNKSTFQPFLDLEWRKQKEITLNVRKRQEIDHWPKESLFKAGQKIDNYTLPIIS